MKAVVYCGSMGDWPLLTDAQRQEGVRRLVDAGIPVVVGTGAQNPVRWLPARRSHGTTDAAVLRQLLPVARAR